MSNTLKGILFVLFLLIAISGVMAVLLIDVQLEGDELIIPVSGEELLPQTVPSATPTAQLMPPHSQDVWASERVDDFGYAAPAYTPTAKPTAAEAPEATPKPVEQAVEVVVSLDPDNWKQWPEIPTVSERARQIYREGLEKGSDPHAFSVLGDCQSLPDAFWGIYDLDPLTVGELEPNLQETVRYFSGSFNRYSPTVKDASTAGAMLWAQWNDNEDGLCKFGETPIDCELRVHRPSIVIIGLGTHWEARNMRYLTIIVEKIIQAGAVPVLATKADNLELDERLNQDMALLADEYDLPLWNFWTAVDELPNHAIDPKSDGMLLTEEGLDIRRESALRALDAIWRTLSAEDDASG